MKTFTGEKKKQKQTTKLSTTHQIEENNYKKLREIEGKRVSWLIW